MSVPTLSPQDLVLRVRMWVFKLAHRLAKVHELDAEDLASETFVRILELAHRYDPSRSSPMVWATWHVRAAADRLRRNRSMVWGRRLQRVHVDPVTGERIIDGRPAPNADAAYRAAEHRCDLDTLLAKARPYGVDVLTRYYGLDGRPPATLRTIAAERGVTVQRVEQIKAKALSHLRDAAND